MEDKKNNIYRDTVLSRVTSASGFSSYSMGNEEELGYKTH